MASLFDFKDPRGRNLVTRGEDLEAWTDASSAAGLFQFLRHHTSAPQTQAEVIGWGGQSYRGINLASQDYLGLSRHPAVCQAAAAACREQGTHSAGSEPMGGGLAEAKHLERELGQFLDHEHVVLFPTGWAAGYGAIKGLIRPYDHVVIDALAHDCLQQGARASTPHVTAFAHNDLASLEKRLCRIRCSDPEAAILVVTESLFSMDSDHPDFVAMTRICRNHAAALMVDVAHDLGVLGPGGRGVLAEQGVSTDVDFVVGSFSKTFACIGGFFASHARSPTYLVRGFSGSYTFSNFLIPAQVAAVRAALAIVAGPEGEIRRRATLENARRLRGGLIEAGVAAALGRESAMVLIPVGDEEAARRGYRSCLERGVILNCIEFPACRRGEARFRMQVSPAHTAAQLISAARHIADAIVAMPETVR